MLNLDDSGSFKPLICLGSAHKHKSPHENDVPSRGSDFIEHGNQGTGDHFGLIRHQEHQHAGQIFWRDPRTEIGVRHIPAVSGRIDDTG